MNSSDTAARLTIRSRVRGRVRWDAPQLLDCPRAASQVETLLRDGSPAITAVTANPRTGRVLIQHDPGADARAIAQALADAVAAGVAAFADERDTAAMKQRAGTGLHYTSGALIASSALLLGLGGSAVLAVTAGALGVAVASEAGTREAEEGYLARLAARSDGGWRKRLARVARDARPYRRNLVVVGILAGATITFAVLKFVFLGVAIDHVVTVVVTAKMGAGAIGLMGPLLFWLGLSVLSTAAQGLCMQWGHVAVQRVAQSMQHDLRIRAYEHIQHAPMGYFGERDRTSVIYALSDDINQIEHIFFAGWEGALILANILFLGLFYFIFLPPAFGTLIILSLPVIVWNSRWLAARAKPLALARREDDARLRAALTESFDGIATIKSFTAEGEELARITGVSSSYAASTEKLSSSAATFRPVFEMVVTGVTTLTVIAGALAAAQGLSAGLFFLVIMATRQLMFPLSQFGRIFEMAQGALTSYERVHALLDVALEDVNAGEPLARDAVSGNLRLEGIEFAYSREQPVLRGMDLDIPAGKTTAIVGPTGCGKSTILQLLLRFYEPDAGHIYLDGKELSELRIRDLRGAIAFASQELFFFKGTVAENIRFASPGAGRDAVIHAAHVACVDDFIADHPHGYDADVGERGGKLSGGERQRVSFARAVLKDAPIMVLDEATSSVDNRTQADIQRRLTEERRGKTTIVVAHRLSTITSADLIYVLAGGHVVQKGTHDQLLAQDGLYAHLWALQLSGGPHA